MHTGRLGLANGTKHLYVVIHVAAAVGDSHNEAHFADLAIALGGC